MTISKLVASRRVYLDGAMGSELLARGFDTARAEKYNLTAPDTVYDIHKGYIDAGADVVYTNTFGCNNVKYDVTYDELSNIILAGVDVARRAASERDGVLVAYSAGPLAELIAPYGKLSFDDAYSMYRAQADIIKSASVDLVVLETFTDLLMLKAAYLAFSETVDLPIWCSMSFDESGRTFNGCSVESFALTAVGLGASAIGVNCGLGPDKMLENVKKLTALVNVPIFVKPNAGLPVFTDGLTSYDTDAEAYSKYMVEIAKLGVSVLGGCCGTNPEYIQKTRAKTSALPFKFFDNKPDAVCSATTVVEMRAPLIIGERVNPTGKPLLKQAIASGNTDYVRGLCVEQLDNGANLLDINVGMGGINETEKLTETVLSVQGAVNCPLSLDSTRIEALDSALRVTAGIPVINSVNGDEKSLSTVLPLAKKYGAYVIALCLDENGIPETAEGRLRIADKIIARAESLGIDRSRLLIDALTMSVSVDANNAIITLQTVNALNSRGLKTVLGLSNVSYGLPAREVINAEFLRRALSVGLFAAIVNPSLKPAANEVAAKLLDGNDNNAEGYVAEFSSFVAAPIEPQKLTVCDCVVKGLRAEGLALAKSLADESNYGQYIDEVIRGLDILGKQYETGKAFLPQLIASAECANAVLDYLKTEFIPERASGEVMLLATVKGDIHDIGKNIVKAVLGNYGYTIIDLGRDVPPETVVDAMRHYKPKYVGLSALMTTTLDNMKLTVEAVKAENPSVTVLVGGAVVTADFASSIGADIYSSDAQDAVGKLAEFKKYK